MKKNKCDRFCANEIFMFGLYNHSILERIAFALWVILMPLAMIEFIIRGETQSWDRYVYKVRRWFYLRSKK